MCVCVMMSWSVGSLNSKQDHKVARAVGAVRTPSGSGRHRNTCVTHNLTTTHTHRNAPNYLYFNLFFLTVRHVTVTHSACQSRQLSHRRSLTLAHIQVRVCVCVCVFESINALRQGWWALYTCVWQRLDLFLWRLRAARILTFAVISFSKVGALITTGS